jgi:nucleoid-associated protein YejK
VATGTPISEIHRQNPHQSEASASFTVASGDTAMTHDFVDTIGAGEGNSAQQEDRHQVQNIHDFSDVEAANQSNHGIKDTKDNQTGRDVTQVGQTHCIGGNKV